MDRIRVTVTREDGYWVAVAEGVRGGATESRRLADLDTEVRDLLAGLMDVEEEQLDLVPAGATARSGVTRQLGSPGLAHHVASADSLS